ncbi:MAG: UDP-3-O-(3-hydroxymyristoyl)glucosamine N-acyltransferase [Aureliella sp.]
MMTVATLGELGKLVEGKVRGDANLPIAHALPLQDVSSDACITMIDKLSSADLLGHAPAAAAVVPLGFPPSRLPVIEVAHPHAAFEKIIHYLRPVSAIRQRGVHVLAQVHPTATIGEGCVIEAGVSVGPGCAIGARSVLHSGVHIMANCTMAEDCELYPGVVLYPETRLGARCLIHAGTVLGAYGFGYRHKDGQHVRSAQAGWVELGDDVELGACVTIDRGTYGATRIGCGSKLDNHVMIGHNCQIGRHNLICAQVGIAGSSTTGDYVVLAGQVGIKDHIRVGDGAVIAAQSGVMHDVPAGETWSGSPAMATKKFMHGVASVARLPEMRGDMRQLQRQLEQCQQQILEMRQQLASRDPLSDSSQRAA